MASVHQRDIHTSDESDETEDLPLVSIIVPVFNQRRELLQCLAALNAQTYPIRRFEVIVVDNGSDEPIDGVSDGFSSVRAIREPKPGSYAARNRGIEASRGQILGFTDADCVPSERWIERGVRAVLGLRGAGIVGGRIELMFGDPQKRTAAELYETVFGFRQNTYLTWGFSTTANLFTTRATLDRVGLFDERLMSGGDMEWGQRVRLQGLAQDYAEDVCVAHPARQTLGQLLKKSRRVAGGLQRVAEWQGLGTAGLSTYAFQQLIQLQRIRATLSDPRLRRLDEKLKFAAAVWLVDLLKTCERYRVHFGGTSSRV